MSAALTRTQEEVTRIEAILPFAKKKLDEQRDAGQDFDAQLTERDINRLLDRLYHLYYPQDR